MYGHMNIKQYSKVLCFRRLLYFTLSLHYRSMLNLLEYILSDDSGGQ